MREKGSAFLFLTFLLVMFSGFGVASAERPVEGDGFQGSGFGDDIDFENNERFTWRFNLREKPSVDRVERSVEAGDRGSFVVEVKNAGDDDIPLRFSVVGNETVRDSVELGKSGFVLGEGSGNDKRFVRVEYDVPDGFEGEFDFKVRAEDASWNGYSRSEGVEFVVFNDLDDRRLVLERFSRVSGSVSVGGSSFPFVLLPLFPALLFFLLLVGVGGFEGKVVALSGFFSVLLFVMVLVGIPAL